MDPDVPTMYFVGGSFVESSFSQPERRFVAQVAKNTAYFNVVNTAYSDTTLLQACLMIIGKLPMVARPGDYVFLCAPQSDPNAFSQEPGYWNTGEAYTPIAPAGAKSTWKGSYKDSHALLAAVASFVTNIELQLVISTSPFRRGDFNKDAWLRRSYRRDRPRYEASQKRRREFDKTIREFAIHSEAYFLDLSKEIDGEPKYFYDEMHLNASGQDRVAALVAEFIDSNLVRDSFAP